MRFLRQNTTVHITVGPFLDKTDGVTPEIALTVTNCHLTLTLDDDDNTAVNLILDAAATASGGDNDMVHITSDNAGFYDLELTQAQTNYNGRAMLAIIDAANHCPVFHEFMIVNTNVYDSLFKAAATDYLQIDTKQWLGQAVTADNNVPEVHVVAEDNIDFGATKKTSVETAVNNKLIAQKLDHLVAVADSDDVVDDSIIAKMVSKGVTADWSGFINTTDALEALRDRGDAAWTTGAGGSDRLLMVDTTIASLASQTSFTLTAGSADDDAYNNCTIVIEDASTATQKAVGIILDYTGSTKTVTLKYDPTIFTMAATDKVYILAENALKSTLANRQLNVAADGDIAGNIDGNVASVTGAVGSVTGHTNQTGDSYAIVNSGTHGNAALKTLVDTNKTELDGLQGADGKALISTDAQDLSGTLDVNTKTIPDGLITAAKIANATIDNATFAADVGSTVHATNMISQAARKGLDDYDPPTRAELTTDKNSIITEVDANETKIDTVDEVVDGIQTDLSNATDGLGALKALIDTIDGIVDTILIDTNELQTNQGNWATATGFSIHNAAAVKTAIEAAGSDLDRLMIALVNKMVTTKASGNVAQYNDANGLIGTINSAITSDATTVTRLRMVQ